MINPPEVKEYNLYELINISEKITSVMNKNKIHPYEFIHALILTIEIMKNKFKPIPYELNELTKEIKQIVKTTLPNKIPDKEAPIATISKVSSIRL